jgi:hypothetical protein
MTYYNYSFRTTLDNGSKSKVQWNWTFLLVKSFKLVPRHLEKGLGPRQINVWFSLHGIILERKPISPNQKKKKKNLQESSRFGKPKCKLKSKVVHFFVFCFFFVLLLLVTQILWAWKTSYKLRILLKTHQLPHFVSILKLTWLVLWILARWMLEGTHFQNFKKIKD